MASDVDVGNGLLNLRHVARDAFAAGAAFLVVCVLLERGGARHAGFLEDPRRRDVFNVACREDAPEAQLSEAGLLS